MEKEIIPNVYILYWMHNGEPRCEGFTGDELSRCLSSAEALRRAQRDGSPISHVCFSSENPNSVGNHGVAEPSADYGWTKRRTTALRKDQA